MGKEVSVWDKVAGNFGKVGPKYWDRFGKRLVYLSRIKSGDKVLDIGIGRGSSMFPAASSVGVDGEVIGIDSSEKMIEESKKEIIERNIQNVKVACMNGKKLEFEKGRFDYIINGFGMGYLIQGDLYLKEIRRVLKSEGHLGLSVWGKQEDQKWLSDILDGFLKKDEKKKSERMIPNFSSVDGLREILHNCEFEDLRLYEEVTPVVYSSKEEWWEEMNANAVRNIFDSIGEMGEGLIEDCKKCIFQGLEKFKREEGYVFRMKVIYAFGKKRN